MRVALVTEYSYSFGEGFANGDATRFLYAEGFMGSHGRNLPSQVAKPLRFGSPPRRTFLGDLSVVRGDRMMALAFGDSLVLILTERSAHTEFETLV